MHFIYTAPDGSVHYCQAAPKAKIERSLGQMTDEGYKAHVIGKSVPPGVTEIIVLAPDWTPPQDRTFRNAWAIRDQRIVVDMPRAREIHRDRLRAQRVLAFQQLDAESLQAVETQDKAKADEVSAHKQKLRDLPAHPAIEAAATPEELAGLTVAKLLATPTAPVT